MDMQTLQETLEKSTISFFSQGSETRGSAVQCSAAQHSTEVLYFQRMNRQKIQQHTSVYQHPNQKKNPNLPISRYLLRVLPWAAAEMPTATRHHYHGCNAPGLQQKCASSVPLLQRTSLAQGTFSTFPSTVRVRVSLKPLQLTRPGSSQSSRSWSRISCSHH
jgi:hypothetical protein